MSLTQYANLGTVYAHVNLCHLEMHRWQQKKLHTPNCIPPSCHQFKCAAASPDPSMQPPPPQTPSLSPLPSPPPQPPPSPSRSSSSSHHRRRFCRHIFFTLLIVVCAHCRRCHRPCFVVTASAVTIAVAVALRHRRRRHRHRRTAAVAFAATFSLFC